MKCRCGGRGGEEEKWGRDNDREEELARGWELEEEIWAEREREGEVKLGTR